MFQTESDAPLIFLDVLTDVDLFAQKDCSVVSPLRPQIRVLTVACLLMTSGLKAVNLD